MSVREKQYLLFKKPDDDSNNYYLIDSDDSLKLMVAKHIKEGVTNTSLVKRLNYDDLKIHE